MNNPFSLEGKKILVTGASSGIGRAVAIECSKIGAHVIASARNIERLNETMVMMGNLDRHYLIVADLSLEQDINNLVESIQCKLDGIVHCAGFTIPTTFQFIKKEQLKSIMGVNFEAPTFLTQYLLKKKLFSNPASIVFISSISGIYISYVANSLYSASKGAINGIVKSMAIELAVKGIRVNCVNPGMIQTNILNSGEITSEQLLEESKKYPLKRFGKPEDVAHAVIYLLSDASSWVTGTNLLIDGGFTLL